MQKQAKMNPNVVIDWNYPAPRPGIAGWIDRISGPGATFAEIGLTLAAMTLGGATMLIYGLSAGGNWNIWQVLLAVVIGTDVVGGVVSNATSASKRWWHRTGQGFWQQLGFTALHLYAIVIVGWLDRGWDWGYIGIMYCYLLTATALTLKTTLYLQRAVGALLVAGAILINAFFFGSWPGFDWFIPAIFLKVLVYHSVLEEPYRPGESFQL